MATVVELSTLDSHPRDKVDQQMFDISSVAPGSSVSHLNSISRKPTWNHWMIDYFKIVLVVKEDNC